VLRSLLESSDSDGVSARDAKYPQFDESKDLQNPEFRVDLEFIDHIRFREALRYDSLRKRYDDKTIKNEKARVTAICVTEHCTWRIHASWDKDKTAFQIKPYIPEHKCKRVLDTHHASSAFLARKYLDTIRDDPDMKWKTLIRTVKRDVGFNITKYKTYMTRRGFRENS